ncbi:DUF676-domain-containing protein [Ramaria rubella]|nr:DUF676-domain-containing protein [Ramaria rubella]
MPRSIHLLVCIHGLWGNPDHLAELARVVRAKYPTSASSDICDPEIALDILVAKSNAENCTYDGVDWGAERVADEVRARLKSIEADGSCKVTRFSVVGYSLGGLIGRYLIGIFYTRGFFEDIRPYNFVTVATPHVGLPRYPGFLSACFNLFGPRFLSRSGRQLSVVDQWSNSSKRPILEVMADKDTVFFKALSLFPHINIYANAYESDHFPYVIFTEKLSRAKDLIVPYVTGAIDTKDPFLTSNNSQIEFDEKYSPMIKPFALPMFTPSPPSRSVFSLDFLRSLRPKPLLIPVPAPIQLLIWIFVPIIFPLFLIYVLAKLSLDSRESRGRIKNLEQENSRSTLVHYLQALEKRTENTVTQAAIQLVDRTTATVTTSTKSSRVERYLTSTQCSLVESLNSLPQMRKHLAYIDGVLNSHAVIVCRNVAKVEMHKRGEGVLRHLADGLVI